MWGLHVVRSGGLIRDGIPSTRPLTAEVAAGLPGHPMAIPTPGHTGGHCSYLVDGVLVSGDALITGHPLLPRGGPQLLPAVFSHSQDDSVRSLAALALLDTETWRPATATCGAARSAKPPSGRPHLPAADPWRQRWRSA